LAEAFAEMLDEESAGAKIEFSVGATEDRFNRIFEKAVNANSLEQYSGTPDWILGEFLGGCLKAFNEVESA